MNEKFLTGTEVAKLLHISRAFAYQLMRENIIPTFRVGRIVRVRLSDLSDFIENNIINNSKSEQKSGDR